MKKIIILLFLINSCFALTSKINIESKDALFGLVSNKSNVSEIQNSGVLNLDSLYRNAKNNENHRLFSLSYSLYKSLINEVLNYPDVYSDSYIQGALPYLIQATSRMAVCAERLQQGKMVKLYDSLLTYIETNELIERVLSFVIDVRAQEKIMISRPLYASLYYYRAYNRVNLAYALVKANKWKNYIVYMPIDILNIISGAVKDIQTFVDFMAHNKVTIEKSVSGNIEFEEKFDVYIKEYIDYAKLYSYEYRMLQLMFATGQDDIIVSSIRKRSTDYAYRLLNTYYNIETRELVKGIKSVSNVSGDGISVLVEKLYYVIH